MRRLSEMGVIFDMKFKITSKFMEHETFRENPHVGIDLAMPNETKLFSVEDGIVSKVISEEAGSSFGNAIFIKLKDGSELVYAHLSEVFVKVNDVVKVNDMIGLSGNSGNSTGFHLHLGLRNANGDWLNPDYYIPLIQSMGDNVMKFSDNIQKLDAAHMLGRALESLTELTINMINFF